MGIGSLRCPASHRLPDAYDLSSKTLSVLPSTFCRSTASVVSLIVPFEQLEVPYHLPPPEGCRIFPAQRSLDSSDYLQALRFSRHRKP